jgi:hypothetical protein
MRGSPPGDLAARRASRARAEVEVLRTLDRLRFSAPAIDPRALAGRREQYEGLTFATHDLALAAAARASGFEVIG